MIWETPSDRSPPRKQANQRAPRGSVAARQQPRRAVLKTAMIDVSCSVPPLVWPVAILVALSVLTLSAAGDVINKDQQLGPVSAQVRLEPAKPLIGDPVTLTLTVTAEEGVELLMPEFGEALDRFTILDFAPRREITDEGTTRATQTYRLQPTASGEQAIPPILIEFVDRRPGQRPTPDDQDAYELLTQRIDFMVESVLPNSASAELKPPLGELQPLGIPPAKKWPAIIASGLLLLAAAPFVWRYLRHRRRAARRRSAYEIARSRLNRLLNAPLPQADDVGDFFVELSGIIRQYLEDRFELRAPELTTEEFLESVGDSSDLTREHQSLLRNFLKQADLVKFAAAQPSEPDIQQALAAADRFLDETQEDAPLIDESTSDPSSAPEAAHV